MRTACVQLCDTGRTSTEALQGRPPNRYRTLLGNGPQVSRPSTFPAYARSRARLLCRVAPARPPSRPPIGGPRSRGRASPLRGGGAPPGLRLASGLVGRREMTEPGASPEDPWVKASPGGAHAGEGRSGRARARRGSGRRGDAWQAPQSPPLPGPRGCGEDSSSPAGAKVGRQLAEARVSDGGRTGCGPGRLGMGVLARPRPCPAGRGSAARLQDPP